MALTDTAVRNAKPKEKPYKLGDSGGLFVIVRPTGKKWWRLKYRFNRKEKLISLGVYPDVSLQEARRRCGEARQLLASGVNPSTKRKAAQADNTGDSFETVAREWFSSKTPNGVPTHSSMVLMRLKNTPSRHWVRGRSLTSDLKISTLCSSLLRRQRSTRPQRGS